MNIKLIILILIILYLITLINDKINNNDNINDKINDKIEGFKSAQSQEINRTNGNFENLLVSNSKKLNKNIDISSKNDYLLEEEILPEIIIKNNKEIIPIKLGTSRKSAYPYKLGNYLRNNIYPTIPIITDGTMMNIELLKNNELNYSLVDEDILCDKIEELPNITAICPLYYQYAVLVLPKEEDNNISKWIDISSTTNKNHIIGVLRKESNSYIYLKKFTVATRIINPEINFTVNIKVYNDEEELINDFLEKKISSVFFMTNQKNSVLRRITDSTEVKLMAPLSRESNQIKSVSELELKEVYEEKKDEVVKGNEIFNGTLFNKKLNLNYFYRSTNTYSFLNTYSSRMILVTNDDNKDRISDITLNIIGQLNNLQYHMNSYELSTRGKFVNDMIDNSFNFKEFASINKKIPLNTTVKKLFINYGLIKEHIGDSCQI